MGGEVEMGAEVDTEAEAEAEAASTMMTMMTETLEVAVVLAEEHTTAGTMEYPGLVLDACMTIKPEEHVKQDQCPKAIDQKPRPTTIETTTATARHQKRMTSERSLDRLLLGKGQPRKAH